MNYSKGISWIDDCRIPFTDEGDIPNDMDKTQLTNNRTFIESGGYKPFLYRQNTQGRFPANLLCSDDVLNDGLSDQGTNSRYYDIDKWFDYLLNKLQNDTDGTIY